MVKKLRHRDSYYLVVNTVLCSGQRDNAVCMYHVIGCSLFFFVIICVSLFSAFCFCFCLFVCLFLLLSLLHRISMSRLSYPVCGSMMAWHCFALSTLLLHNNVVYLWRSFVTTERTCTNPSRNEESARTLTGCAGCRQGEIMV